MNETVTRKMLRVSATIVMLLAAVISTISCEKFGKPHRSFVSFEIGDAYFVGKDKGRHSECESGFFGNNSFSIRASDLSVDYGETDYAVGSLIINLTLEGKQFPEEWGRLSYTHNSNGAKIEVQLFPYAKYQYFTSSTPLAERQKTRVVVKEGKIFFSTLKAKTFGKEWKGTFDLDLDVEYLNDHGFAVKTVPVHLEQGRFVRY